MARTTDTQPKWVEATDGAVMAGLSREALIRRIQRRELKGERRAGRWFVDLRSLLKATSKTATVSK